MKIVGIVAEFNPFHNGHRYLVEKARENNDTYIVAVMGGNFMQRGSCAVLGKYHRAKAAVLGGVDLVLELPQVYACASAERFARGAVRVLRACGCVDTICCGSENMPPMASLIRAAEILKSAELSQYLKKGCSYPRAVQAAVEASGDKQAAQILRYPNDVLAFEYFKECMDDFDFHRVRRTVPHDGGIEGNDKFCSASAVRKMMLNGEDYRRFVPETTAAVIDEAEKNGECPASLQNNERGVLSVLRKMSLDEIKALPDVGEGLENRIYKAVHANNSIDGIISDIKCKRYTHARLSRIIACAYLGITNDLSGIDPQYIRVLAFNGRGAQVLKEMKKTAKLPIVMNARGINSLEGSARAMIDIDIKANDLFNLCTPEIKPCGEDFYRSVFVI